MYVDFGVSLDVLGLLQLTVPLCLLFQMIANAGTIEMRPLVDMTVEDWERIMSINVRSVMLAYKQAARQMIKQGRGGRIVGALTLSTRILLLLPVPRMSADFA